MRWLRLAVLPASVLALSACGGGELPGGGQAAAPATSTAVAVPTSTAPSAGATPHPHTTGARARTTPGPSSPRPRPSTQRRSGTTTSPARTTTTSRTAAPARTAPQRSNADDERPIDETARLTLVSKVSEVEYTQHGPVTGTFDGEMTLTAKVTAAGVNVRFTATLDGGTVVGHGLVTPRLTSEKMSPVSGTASITGGTGRFAHIRGDGLTVKGRVALDGSKAVVRLAGTVVY